MNTQDSKQVVRKVVKGAEWGLTLVALLAIVATGAMVLVQVGAAICGALGRPWHLFPFL